MSKIYLTTVNGEESRRLTDRLRKGRDPSVQCIKQKTNKLKTLRFIGKTKLEEGKSHRQLSRL